MAKIDDVIDDWPLNANYDGNLECGWHTGHGDEFKCCYTEFSTYLHTGDYTVRLLRQQIQEHITTAHPEALS